jgi:hypothetical protein
MNKFLIMSAAALALLPGIASAQTMMPATGTFGTTPSLPMATPNIFEITPIPASEKLDYHLLYNNTFNKVDIDQAKSAHYSDEQIAKIYKIAKLTNRQFRDIYSLVRDGQSFYLLSEETGVSLFDLNNCQKEQDEIDGYESAYAGTGLGNLNKPKRVMSSIDSSVNYDE